MNLQAKLHKKEELKSGISATSGKPWSMIKFTVLQKGFKEPTELDLTAFNGDLVSFIADTTIGTPLLLEIVVESKTKEWNGRTWRGTEVKCLRAETIRENDVTTETDHKGVQQMAQMHNQQYERAKDVGWKDPNDGSGDDLPFNQGETDQPLKNKEMVYTPLDSYESFIEKKEFKKLVEIFDLELV